MYMNTTYSTKQSAVAMRKRMSDDTNKYNFNRKRVLDRIREGSIPQQKTTKKYDIPKNILLPGTAAKKTDVSKFKIKSSGIKKKK